jgi:hypothetical protein
LLKRHFKVVLKRCTSLALSGMILFSGLPVNVHASETDLYKKGTLKYSNNLDSLDGLVRANEISGNIGGYEMAQVDGRTALKITGGIGNGGDIFVIDKNSTAVPQNAIVEFEMKIKEVDNGHGGLSGKGGFIFGANYDEITKKSTAYDWIARQDSSSIRIRRSGAGDIMGSSDKIIPGQWQTWRVEYYQDNLRLYINNQEQYNGKIPGNSLTRQGLLGFMIWSETETYIDNLKVYDLVVDNGSGSGGNDEVAVDVHEMQNSNIKVTVDKTFPQALNYELKATGGLLYGGYPNAEHKILINGGSYDVGEVTFTPNDDGSVDYLVPVAGFEGGISIKYHFALEGNELVRTITGISGTGEPKVTSIKLDIPVLRAKSSQQNANIAFEKEQSPDRFNNYSGDLAGDQIGAVAAQSDYTEYTSWAFLYTPNIVGSVYNNLIDIPLQAKVKTINGVKHAGLYEREYYYRLSYKPNSQNGLLPERLIDTNLSFESRVYIGADSNRNSVIDWQDGALWVRDQLPKRPQNLEDFYAAGGAWQQTHGTFPDNATSSTVSTHYSIFAPQMRQVFYQTGGSPQSFEVAGWQQHGHDWRWADWEQPVNPGAGGMEAAQKARNEMLKYGGDLSFHNNHEITVPEADSYDVNVLARKSDGSPQMYSAVFGQSTFRIKSYFLDWAAGYTENRVNKFVKDQFWAPTYIYNDQMWDNTSPYNGVYGVHESFAKKKIIETFGANGVNMTTEGYQPTNLRNGLLTAKYRNNNSSRIDDFVTAGVLNWQFSAPQVADLFGGRVTGEYRSGNLNAKDNQFANVMIDDNYMYAYLSAYMRKYPAMEYIDNTSMSSVRWGNNLIAKHDKTNGYKLVVTEGNVTIADGTDRFIPDLKGEKKVYVYSQAGSKRDWVLPASWSGVTKVDRYELTESGKSYIDRIDVVNGKVNLYTPAKVPFIIVPAETKVIKAGPVNNAIGKVVTADSNLGNDVAQNAIDGNGATVWTSNSGSNSYLEVNLGRETEVNRIELIEQGNKIRGYKLQYLSDGTWVDIKSGTTIGSNMRIVFPNIRSEKIRLLITDTDSNPQIAEFKIFADANLSMSASATSLSGNWDTMIAKDDRGVNVTYKLDARDLRAKDGSLETYWRPSQTANTWLEMAFSRSSQVNRAVIHEIGNSVTGYKIQAFDGVNWIDVYTGTTIGNTAEINFSTVSATKVRLLITSATATPKISEFQVFGVDNAIANIAPQDNLALNKFATQSSVYTASLSPAVASRAVDGNVSGNWYTQSIAATAGNEDNPWWKVDLGQVYDIGEIKLYGRDGSGWTRLAYCDISILDKDGNVVWTYYQATQPNPSVTIKVAGLNQEVIKGQFIKIQQRKISGRANEQLEIAEVQVYAPKITQSVDKSTLQAIYDECMLIEKSNYTEVTWSAFVEARNAAKSVIDKTNATYDEVRIARDNLFYAREHLVMDTAPPTIIGTPSDITVEATSSAGAVINFIPPTADDLVDGKIGVICDYAPISIFSLGTTTVTCTAEDKVGNKATSSFTVAVQDTTSPTLIGTPSEITVEATSSAGAVINFIPPTANDLVDGVVEVVCDHESGSSFPLGTTTVTCTATDKAGNESSTTFDVTVSYSWSGILKPINTDGSSIFKLGCTIPVKFKFSGTSAGITDAIVSLKVSKITDEIIGTEIEAISTSSATIGSHFRYDSVDGQYIFNLGTSELKAGTYQIRVEFGDGSINTINISLK